MIESGMLWCAVFAGGDGCGWWGSVRFTALKTCQGISICPRDGLPTRTAIFVAIHRFAAAETVHEAIHKKHRLVGLSVSNQHCLGGFWSLEISG